MEDQHRIAAADGLVHSGEKLGGQTRITATAQDQAALSVSASVVSSSRISPFTVLRPPLSASEVQSGTQGPISERTTHVTTYPRMTVRACSMAKCIEFVPAQNICQKSQPQDRRDERFSVILHRLRRLKFTCCPFEGYSENVASCHSLVLLEVEHRVEVHGVIKAAY